MPVTVKELTCPKGHTNSQLDWGTWELTQSDLPCTFNHYGKVVVSVENKKELTTDFRRWLLSNYGWGTFTALGLCRECGLFWWVRFDETKAEQCCCDACEIERLRRGIQPIDEAIFQTMPYASRRAAAGVPLFGQLTPAQQAKVDALPDIAVILRRFKPVRFEPSSINDEIGYASGDEPF